ncbi:MAG TPA: hypothetical protein VEZ70_00235 [Allosphingosinicella sp.]|nr:hypothetical protein [Allosphingosinicella sp.]
MTKIIELNARELDLIVGGVIETTTTNPITGETVTRDCTGNVIRRSGSVFISL